MSELEPKKPKPAADAAFGRTDVGQVREHNEDNFLVADLTQGEPRADGADRTQVVGERGTVLGVCDGMGGAAAGEVASQLAVDIIYQRCLRRPPHDHDDLAARLVRAIEPPACASSARPSSTAPAAAWAPPRPSPR
jgi:serine/threonine protein phosphatase PrpC